MELTREHREALLNELEKANEDLALQKHVIEKNRDPGGVEWHEVSHYLAQKRIEAIKAAITENEIDY